MDGFEVKQYLHRPNSTELGQGNTHETYLQIKAGHNIDDMFPVDTPVVVEDVLSSNSYTLKSASGREFRVNQMGEIYRNYDIHPGDEIKFTLIIGNNIQKRLFEVKKYNRVVFSSCQKGTEIINVERLNPYFVNGICKMNWLQNGQSHSIHIENQGFEKKRSDSPNLTQFFKVILDGKILTSGTYYLSIGNSLELQELDKSELFQCVLSYNLVSMLHEHIKSDYVPTKVLGKNFPSLKRYFPIIRTKPFLLLAGISGTGKSRIVKEMAFSSCPDIEELRKDDVAPGNYLLVEVKPNWHDSTELLGYESSIKETYVLTPFIRFLFKAMHYPNVPFFVCLDEMNLAPVEQYFAEFLSVLESRKLDGDKIKSEPLIPAEVFVKYPALYYDLMGIEKPNQNERNFYSGEIVDEEYASYDLTDFVFNSIKERGLQIPQNVIVVGTVNMDETTHQFSRKVIDRAMTIEMNEVNFDNFFETSTDLGYVSDPLPAKVFLPKYTSAKQALAAMPKDAEYIKQQLPKMLKALNEALNNTPFKIAYRVQNEVVLYLAALREDAPDEKIEKLFAIAFDEIMLMKVLPRIEGDEEMLENPLSSLLEFAENLPKSKAKIQEMQVRLGSGHFTSFWP